MRDAGPWDSFGTADPHPVWRASESTRTWLLFAIPAVLLSGGLSIVAAVLESQAAAGAAPAAALALERVLELVAIVPELIVVVALLKLGRETTSRGLWKGALGCFLSGWLFVPLAMLSDGVLVPPWTTVATVVVGGGLALLLLLFVLPVPRWSSPAAVSNERAAEPRRRGLGFGTVIGALIVFRILVRLLNAVPGAGMAGLADPDVGALAGFAGLFLCATLYGLRFGAALVGTRDRLGFNAALLGGLQLLWTLAQAVVVGLLIAAAVQLAQQQPPPDAAAVEQLWHDHTALVGPANLVIEAGWSLLAAAMFLLVRRRSEPDWRESLWSQAGGRAPWG